MVFSRAVVAALSTLTSTLPRIKGLGLLLGLIAKRFRTPNVTITRKVFGSYMALNSSDLIGNMLLFTPNYYDRTERKFVRSILREGDYAVDIGANIGAYSLLFAKFVGPTGLVTAIEAEKYNASVLEKNIALNDLHNVIVKNVGVSDKKETLQLMLNLTGNAGGHSFYSQENGEDHSLQQVECLPLRNLLEPRPIRLMKLDIEGFECRALTAYFNSTAAGRKPEFIILEDNPDRREGDAVALCIEHGYRIVQVVDYNVILALTTQR